MCYNTVYEDHPKPAPRGIVIRLRPQTEIPLLLYSLEHDGASHMPLYRSLRQLHLKAARELEVHHDITSADLLNFFPMMHALEEQIPVTMTARELWAVHGALDHYFWAKRPDCKVTAGVLELFSTAVGDLDHPPE